MVLLEGELQDDHLAAAKMRELYRLFGRRTTVAKERTRRGERNYFKKRNGSGRGTCKVAVLGEYWEVLGEFLWTSPWFPLGEGSEAGVLR